MKPVRAKGKPILLVRQGGSFLEYQTVAPHIDCSSRIEIF
jgi:hypothetical protein